MSNLDLNNINVLNYNENEVYVETNRDKYKFNASRDGVRPTMLTMSLNELKAINSNTNIIAIGTLTFEDEFKAEIYRELRIPEWEDILTNKQIRDIIAKPTMEGLERIIAIDNSAYFERVRAAKLKLINEGVDVSTNVRNIIDRRFRELQNRQRKTSIQLNNSDVAQPGVASEEVKALSEQNASLQAQLDEMKKMMQAMMSGGMAQPVVAKEEPVIDAPKKKRGRPPKNKTE